MALYNAKPGLGHTSEYQAAGIPVAGSLTRAVGSNTATFNRVTRAITFWSTSAVTINFGDDGQIVTIPTDQIIRVEIKTNILAVDGTSAGGTLFFVAELTGIEGGQCPTWNNDDNEYYTIS